ncbi:probable uridine nucleosidase 2 [Trichogramma pretiosum]|uniref:probable uridine nucleosidase 2 n=1 Tax=Trichogramma pretiosum TaxID=7493 RepID=UPI0006C98386|nr:probable uridine nucleosidase 2 [Trichogramma pretiosum]
MKTFLSAFFLVLYFHKFDQCSGEKLIVNTDGGADDAIAIIMLLLHERLAGEAKKFEVIGIICSYGNTREPQVERNVLRVLTLLGREDIPVYEGPQIGFNRRFASDSYFGEDGFGNAKFDWPVKGEIRRTMPAHEAIIELARKHSGDVSVVSLGPTTNVAKAILYDDDLTSHLNYIYTMGGNVADPNDPTSHVEFNFLADPKSNFILFDAANELQVILVPWETVTTTGISKEWRVNVLGKIDSPIVDFMNKIEAISLSKEKTMWTSSDALLVACMLDPALIRSVKLTHVEAIVTGPQRGTIIMDDRSDALKNTIVIEKIDYIKLKYFKD